MIVRISLLLTLLLTACAPMGWNKPGASQNDLSKDKYTCLQQAQQRVSNAKVDVLGGSANNSVITNDTLFNSCMNANGWYFTTQEAARQQVQYQQQSQQTIQQPQEKNQQIKDVFTEASRQVNEFCQMGIHKIIYAKSPCKLDEISLEQLSDPKKISKTEKPAFLAIHSENQEITKKAISKLKSIGNAKALEVGNAIQKLDGMSEANDLALYEGSASWGQYNKRRKEISQISKNELNQVLNSK